MHKHCLFSPLFAPLLSLFLLTSHCRHLLQLVSLYMDRSCPSLSQSLIALFPACHHYVFFPVDSVVATCCGGPRRDTDGQQLCELCPRRLSQLGAHRPYFNGRAHQSCIIREKRAAAAGGVAASTVRESVAMESAALPPSPKKRRIASDPGESALHPWVGLLHFIHIG